MTSSDPAAQGTGQALPPGRKTIQSSSIRLETGQHLRIPRAHGVQISCVSGLVWVTASSQLHDWVLQPGESAEFSATSVLVGALGDSEIRLAPHAADATHPVSARRALIDLFARRLLRSPPSLGMWQLQV